MANFIGILISIAIIVLLMHPQVLPFSPETIEKIQELRTDHFLIEGSGKITLAHIATLILALCTVFLVYTVLKLLLRLIERKDEHSATISILLIGVLRYLAVIIAFIWGLSILGVNTTAVLAGAGIIGLVIGFGAQSLIEDIITGMFIIFERQYEIGDIIILDDFRGVVRNIGVRTTVIEDAGGNLKVVNNSDIRNFQNRSKNDSYAVTDIGVSYRTDIKKMEQVLLEAMPEMYAAHKNLYLEKPEYLGVEALSDSSMVLRLRVKTKEDNVFAAKRQLNRDVKLLFDAAGIEIPFPQIVVHQED